MSEHCFEHCSSAEIVGQNAAKCLFECAPLAGAMAKTTTHPDGSNIMAFRLSFVLAFSLGRTVLASESSSAASDRNEKNLESSVHNQSYGKVCALFESTPQHCKNSVFSFSPKRAST